MPRHACKAGFRRAMDSRAWFLVLIIVSAREWNRPKSDFSSSTAKSFASGSSHRRESHYWRVRSFFSFWEGWTFQAMATKKTGGHRRIYGVYIRSSRRIQRSFFVLSCVIPLATVICCHVSV